TKDKTLYLAQVTDNGYGPPLEAKINFDLAPLAKLIGPKAIRLRFDPIIGGITKPSHIHETLHHAVEQGIDHLTVNFFISSYKRTGLTMTKNGILWKEIYSKYGILQLVQSFAIEHHVNLAICAECSGMSIPKGVLSARCADAQWAKSLRPDLNFTTKPSRKGCGCCYNGDWGVYKSQGGWTCPHKCVYCYAK
ncbi:MAG: DUF1848 domain-containing protein, partial [bacterium]|nr:DUF1848 domain-containing protein [bacterium]